MQILTAVVTIRSTSKTILMCFSGVGTDPQTTTLVAVSTPYICLTIHYFVDFGNGVWRCYHPVWVLKRSIAWIIFMLSKFTNVGDYLLYQIFGMLLLMGKICLQCHHGWRFHSSP